MTLGNVNPPGNDAHRIDDGVPVPARTTPQLLTEAALAGPHLLLMIGRLLKDPRVALRRKLVAVGVAGYLLSPLDLIPDFVPMLGQLDDLVLAAVAVKVLSDGVAPEVLRQYWPGSDDAFDLVSAVSEWGAEMVPTRLRRLLVP